MINIYIMIINNIRKTHEIKLFSFIGFSNALRIALVAAALGVQNLSKGYSQMCLFIGLAYIILPLITGTQYNDFNYLSKFFLAFCIFIMKGI